MQALHRLAAAMVLCAVLPGVAMAQQPPAAVRAASAPAPKTAKSAGPAWAELSAAQQQSLRPLEARWASISEAQKRKWIALAQNYPKMPAAEQAKLHSRMTEWVALSPQQRTQARLNFADTRKIPVDDKKAKWEAYQSLSSEEKRRLAAKAAPKAPGAAAAVKPVPAQKLAKVPSKNHAEPKDGALGAVSSGLVDHNTLLPQKGAAATPAAVSTTH